MPSGCVCLLLPAGSNPDFLAWDNDSHLYALSNQKLYVFTVTATSHAQAPGSPHSIPNGDNLLVHAMTQ